MAATTYYHSSDYSSDESSDWSDSPRTRRKTTRKNKSTLSKNASGKGAIRKAKKPGRKPMETFDELPSDPKLKRKVQNRAAQRAFRERKEQFVVELQGQLRELEEAKEKREKELQKEMSKLKRENEKLKQEMDELKNKFPQVADKSNPTPMISPPITDDQIVSSPEQIGHQDESFYYDKTSDLSDYQGSTPMTDSLSSISAHPFSSPSYNDSVPELDFSMNDAFGTFNNDPLQSLFGTELDLFGTANTTMPPQELDPFFAEQMQALTEQDKNPENEKHSKKKILYLLNLAKGANRKISQLDEDFKVACPDGNMEQLCGALRQKVTFDRNHIMTDDEVDLYIECIKRNN